MMIRIVDMTVSVSFRVQGWPCSHRTRQQHRYGAPQNSALHTGRNARVSNVLGRCAGEAINAYFLIAVPTRSKALPTLRLTRPAAFRVFPATSRRLPRRRSGELVVGRSVRTSGGPLRQWLVRWRPFQPPAPACAGTPAAACCRSSWLNTRGPDSISLPHRRHWSRRRSR